MNQNILIDLQFEKAKLRYRDKLKELDNVIFPDGGASLADMECGEANDAIERAFEDRLHCGNTKDNLKLFASRFAPGISFDNCYTVREIIIRISEYETEIY